MVRVRVSDRVKNRNKLHFGLWQPLDIAALAMAEWNLAKF